MAEFLEPEPFPAISVSPPGSYYGNEKVWGNKTTLRGIRLADNRLNFFTQVMQFMSRWQQLAFAGQREELYEIYSDSVINYLDSDSYITPNDFDLEDNDTIDTADFDPDGDGYVNQPSVGTSTIFDQDGDGDVDNSEDFDVDGDGETDEGLFGAETEGLVPISYFDRYDEDGDPSTIAITFEDFDTNDDGEIDFRDYEEIKIENFDFTSDYIAANTTTPYVKYYEEGSWHTAPEFDELKKTLYGDDIFWGVANGYYYAGYENYEKVNFNDPLWSFQHSTLGTERGFGNDVDFDGDGNVDGSIEDSLPINLYYDTVFYPNKERNPLYSNYYDSTLSTSVLMPYANLVDYSGIWGAANNFLSLNAKSWGDVDYDGDSYSGGHPIEKPTIYELANTMYSDTVLYETSGNVPSGYEQYDYRQIFSSPDIGDYDHDGDTAEDTGENALNLLVTMLESFRRIAYLSAEIFGMQTKYFHDTTTDKYAYDDNYKILDEGMMNHLNNWLYGVDDDPVYKDYRVYDNPTEANWKISEAGTMNMSFLSMFLKIQHNLLMGLYPYFYGSDPGSTGGYRWPFAYDVSPTSQFLRTSDFRLWLRDRIFEYYDFYKSTHSVSGVQAVSDVDNKYNEIIGYYEELKTNYDDSFTYSGGTGYGNWWDGGSPHNKNISYTKVEELLDKVYTQFDNFIANKNTSKDASKTYLGVVTAGLDVGYDYTEEDNVGTVISSWQILLNKLFDYKEDWETNKSTYSYDPDGDSYADEYLTEAGKNKVEEFLKWLKPTDSQWGGPGDIYKVIELIRADGDPKVSEDEDGYSDYLFWTNPNKGIFEARGALSLLKALYGEEEYIANGYGVAELYAEFSMGNSGLIYNRGKDDGSGVWQQDISITNLFDDSDVDSTGIIDMENIYSNYGLLYSKEITDDIWISAFGPGSWGLDQGWGRGPIGRDPTAEFRYNSSHWWYTNIKFYEWDNADGDDYAAEDELESFWGNSFAKGDLYNTYKFEKKDDGYYWVTDYKRYSQDVSFADYIWVVHNFDILENFLSPLNDQSMAIYMLNDLNDAIYDIEKEDYDDRKEKFEENEIYKAGAEKKRRKEKALLKKIALRNQAKRKREMEKTKMIFGAEIVKREAAMKKQMKKKDKLPGNKSS
jgi:hypothetical protein